VAPAALPSAPVTSGAPPTVSWGAATPGGDRSTAPSSEEKKQSPFYFTRFNWTNTASTKIFGVGSDYIGTDDSQYTMSFTLQARYYFLNRDSDKAYVSLNMGMVVELTDSSVTTTTREHQPLFNDMVVGIGYGHTVYRSVDGQWKTTPGVAASFTLPTSTQSMGQGKYLTVGLNGSLIQSVPLAGSKSDWFPDMLALGSLGYYHLFSRCTTPCNDNLDAYPRQVAGVATIADAAGGGGAGVVLPSSVGDDQLAGAGLALDKARFNVTYFLTIYKDLSFANTWDLLLPFKREFPSTTVSIPTGPVQLAPSITALNPVTTFDVSFSYLLFNTARIDVGYQNITPELVDNAGQRTSVFYAPGGAAFYGNVSVYLDNLIDKAMNPPDKKEALGMGRFHVLR
jgi:hypothetical protein